jgi:hypothetical protein
MLNEKPIFILKKTETGRFVATLILDSDHQVQGTGRSKRAAKKDALFMSKFPEYWEIRQKFIFNH